MMLAPSMDFTRQQGKIPRLPTAAAGEKAISVSSP